MINQSLQLDAGSNSKLNVIIVLDTAFYFFSKNVVMGQIIYDVYTGVSSSLKSASKRGNDASEDPATFDF